MGAPKSPYNIKNTFFNSRFASEKNLRFEHGGAKRVSCPGRHLTSLRSWACLAFIKSKLYRVITRGQAVLSIGSFIRLPPSRKRHRCWGGNAFGNLRPETHVLLCMQAQCRRLVCSVSINYYCVTMRRKRRLRVIPQESAKTCVKAKCTTILLLRQKLRGELKTSCNG